MYTLLATLFILGAVLIGAGFIGKIGTTGISDISENFASAFGLLFTYSFLILSMSSFSELASFFEAFCGGIPFFSEIAEYGSLKNVLTESPLSAAQAFFDSVIVSFIIEVIFKIFPRTYFPNKFMTELLTAVLAAIVSLLLLNYLVKESEVYQWAISAIGMVISALSIGTITMPIILLFDKTTATGAGLIGLAILFSTSEIAGVLRSSFLKAIVYVAGIWVLESQCGDLANGFSLLSTLLVAFMPAIIMIIGLFFIVQAGRS